MGIDRDVWLKALADSGMDILEDDQGAVTLNEFATTFGMKRTAASDMLRRLVASGGAVVTKKWVVNAYGRRQHLTAYRLAEKPKKGVNGRSHRRSA